MKVEYLLKSQNFRIFKVALIFLKSRGYVTEINNWSELSDSLKKAVTLLETDDTNLKRNFLNMLVEIKELGESELNDNNAVVKYTQIIDKYRRDIVDLCDEVYKKHINPNEELRIEYVRTSLLN